jgi:hypothetical protein
MLGSTGLFGPLLAAPLLLLLQVGLLLLEEVHMRRAA